MEMEGSVSASLRTGFGMLMNRRKPLNAALHKSTAVTSGNDSHHEGVTGDSMGSDWKNPGPISLM
jgi:hypothetical protein